jgi:hypothetical protein
MEQWADSQGNPVELAFERACPVVLLTETSLIVAGGIGIKDLVWVPFVEIFSLSNQQRTHLVNM